MMLSVFNCSVSVIGCCGKCCSCCVVVFLSIYKFKILVFLLWRLVYRYVFLRSKFKGCKSLGWDCHINK